MKRKTVRFRCSVYEQKLLKVKAKKAGLTLSEYCRRAVFQDRIVERLTEEQIDLYKMLVQYRNNFIRIGNMFRKRNAKLAEEVTLLAKAIEKHLYSFRE